MGLIDSTQISSFACIDTHPHPTPPDERAALVQALARNALSAMRALSHEARRAFEGLDLRPSHVVVLELIERGCDRPGLLAEQLDTVQSAVSAILSELQQRDLIERSTDPVDRRRARLRLTPQGRSALQDAGRRWHDRTRDRLATLPIEELRSLDRAVHTLVREANA